MSPIIKKKWKKKNIFTYHKFCIILLQDSVTGDKHIIGETWIGVKSTPQKQQGHTIP
jgi:hypothetical protein